MSKRIDPKLPIAPVAGDDPAVALMKPDRYMDRLVRRLNELFREFGGTISLEDEGVYLGEVDTLNFTGDAVTATIDSNGIGVITITAAAGAGVTLATLSVIATENVVAGDLINIYSVAGAFRGRKAKASAAGYEAYGWTDAAVSASATVTVNFLGKNTHASGLTPGPVYLAQTAGTATSTCPSGTGIVAQEVGVADTASEYAFEWHPPVLQAATHAVSTSGILQSVSFTSSATWTVPAGLTACWVDMYAGGGGGGGGVAANGGGGGGSGEYCQGMLIPLTSSTLVITIGAGGAASALASNGNDGANTTVGTWTVLGGHGGISASSTSLGGAGGGIRGGASSANVGTSETPFFFGGSAGGAGAGTHAPGGGSGGRLSGGASGGAGGGGGGGATPIGSGGAGGAASANGSDAAANTGGGGGGGGSGTNTSGGAGGSGMVVIYYIA